MELHEATDRQVLEEFCRRLGLQRVDSPAEVTGNMNRYCSSNDTVHISRHALIVGCPEAEYIFDSLGELLQQHIIRANHDIRSDRPRDSH